MGSTGLTLAKKERLTGEISINELFEKGEFFLSYPYRIGYIRKAGPANSSVKVMFAVPKKKFKHAVDRNRVKRLMREAYRKNKETLYTTMSGKNDSIHLSITFVATEILSWQVMEQKWISAQQKLLNKLL